MKLCVQNSLLPLKKASFCFLKKATIHKRTTVLFNAPALTLHLIQTQNFTKIIPVTTCFLVKNNLKTILTPIFY